MEKNVVAPQTSTPIWSTPWAGKIMAILSASGFLPFLFLPRKFDWIGLLLVVLASVWAGLTYGKESA